MKHTQKKRPKFAGLSVEKFANAKGTRFDKQHEKERQFALNAKRVNKYRKLKTRLEGDAERKLGSNKVG
jgi:hypothetical protein